MMRCGAWVLTALLVAGCGNKADEGAGSKAQGGEQSAAPEALKVKEAAGPKLDHPPTEEGARALLQRFLAPGADTRALSQALRPTTAEYQAAFVPEAAKKAEEAYAAPWDAGALNIAPKSGQTELLLWKATSEELQSKSGDAGHFPGGYEQVAAQLQPGVTWYRFKFVEPGNDLGMAFDGLTHVNGRWVIFPKPWRALQ